MCFEFIFVCMFSVFTTADLIEIISHKNQRGKRNLKANNANYLRMMMVLRT